MSGNLFLDASRAWPNSGLRYVRRIQQNQSLKINLWRRLQHDNLGNTAQSVPQKVRLAHRNAIAEEISSREVELARMSEPDALDKSPAPTGALSVVFTDIVKSTAIWETDVSAMAQAMTMHDNIIRKLSQEHDGYEVKQNGDGFMFAFQNASSAIQFCLDTQQELLDATWPEDLLKLQPGRQSKDEDGQVLFRGLRLRMSAHWGTPICKWNNVIKRMDYLGPMVNRAARYIEVTEAGQIVVSGDFLVELQGSRDSTQKNPQSESNSLDVDNNKVNEGESGEFTTEDLERLRSPKEQEILADQQFEIKLLGEYDFKGLSEPEKLYFLVPKSLRGRLDVWPKHSHISGSKGNLIPSGS